MTRSSILLARATTRAWIICASLLLTSLIWCERARAQSLAQTAAILPLRTEKGADPKIAAATEQGVRTFFEALHVQVLSAKAVREKLPRPFRHDCADATCLDKLRQTIGADHLIRITVYATHEGHSVGINWVDREALGYGGTAKLEEETPAAAAAAAYAAMIPSHAQQQRGAGPWLAVDGEPAGATVRVNGVSQGVVPYFGRVEPGGSRITISKAGFETHEEQIEIAGNPESFRQLRVELKPLAQATSATPAVMDPTAAKPMPAHSSRSRASSWNYVAGTTLAVGAAALLIYGLVSSEADDDCVRETELMRCIQTGDTEARAIGAFVGAGIAATGSAVFFTVQPFVDASSDENAAGMRATITY